jgi:drug/metabolite transporter (DMT)-like permease
VSARTKSYLLLLVVYIIWGVAGPVIKFTLGYFDPVIFLLYRFGLAGILAAITLVVFPQHSWPQAFSQKFWVIIYCILSSTVALGFLFLGYDKTSALTGSILNAIYPILTALVGMWFLKETITHRENVGMGIALLGTFLIVAEPYLSGQSTAASNSTLEGNLLVIASLLVGVLTAVMAKLLLRTKLSAFALTQLSFLVGLITIIPIALYYYPLSTLIQLITQAPWQAHAGVWYMAFASGTFAYTLWHIGQKTIEIGESALFSYLYPIITLPLSLFWLHERITWIYIASAVVIGVGIVIAETKKKKVLVGKHLRKH